MFIPALETAFLLALGGVGARSASSADIAQAARASAVVSRAERLAEIFERIVANASSRRWQDLRAAFPGVRWEAEPTDDPAERSEYALTTIDVGGTPYFVAAGGTPTRVNTVHFSMTAAGALMDHDLLRAAVRARGMTWTFEYCDESGAPNFGIGAGRNWVVVALRRTSVAQGRPERYVPVDSYMFDFDASPGASEHPEENTSASAEMGGRTETCG